MKWLVCLLFPVFCVQAQSKMNWDTTRYQKFRYNFIVGAFQSYRNYNISFEPVHRPAGIAASNDYMAESALCSGIDVNFDKVGFSLGLRTRPQDYSAGKGYTKTFCLGFNTGGNIWFLETGFRSFKGFYDAGTPSYDTTFYNHHQYHTEPNLLNQTFKTKFFYFTNHKRYSFRSNYSANYRQLHTGGTWILSANLNYNRVHNDAPFFSPDFRSYYQGLAQLNNVAVVGLSANAGAAFTIVIWRAMFLHIMCILGPEQQWRRLGYINKDDKTISYLALSGDFRVSYGFNWKRAYMVWTTSKDFTYYNTSVMRLSSTSMGGCFSFGLRFVTKTPKAYQKFQQTTIYSYL